MKGIATTNKNRDLIMRHNVQTRQAHQRKNLVHMSIRNKLVAQRMPLMVGTAMIVLATSGIAAVTAWVSSSTRSPPLGAEALLPYSPAEGGPRVRVRCAECGVVAAKRKIGQAGAGIKGYEITVRMMDGSSRAFMEANPETWRLGQRLILIDGA